MFTKGSWYPDILIRINDKTFTKYDLDEFMSNIIRSTDICKQDELGKELHSFTELHSHMEIMSSFRCNFRIRHYIIRNQLDDYIYIHINKDKDIIKHIDHVFELNWNHLKFKSNNIRLSIPCVMEIDTDKLESEYNNAKELLKTDECSSVGLNEIGIIVTSDTIIHSSNKNDYISLDSQIIDELIRHICILQDINNMGLENNMDVFVRYIDTILHPKIKRVNYNSNL